ncbi:MAG: PASTA domain-containing protein, partial [Nocardioidaceae bacterium]
ADFGLARAVSSVTAGGASTSTGVLIGTVSYLAPELVLSHGSDARSDVYACGAVLYEMLTGYKPHTGETPIQIAYRHVHEDVPPPSRRVTGIPPYVDALIARATSRDRDQRSADARVLLRQLRQVRHALDRGLTDEPELTSDLIPRAVPVPTPSPPPPGQEHPEPSAGGGDATLVVGTNGGTSSKVGRPPPYEAPLGPPEPPAGGTPTEPVPMAAPRKRRHGMLWIAAVLLLAVLAAAGGFYFGVARYSTTPALTGETERSARAIAEDRGLSIEVADEAFSETANEGTVIDTDPEAGENILDGGTVDVTLSKGKERYDVPDVEGMTEDQASDALTAENLDVGEVIRRYSERLDTGEVMRASIKAGTSVKDGTDVDLYVSKGRRPIWVESYVGEPGRDARAALQQAGFEVEMSRSYDDDVPAGDVISQSPDSGSAYRRDTINLVVSRGPSIVTVPDVRLQTVDDATAALEAEGLKVETVEDELSVGAGIVREQSPAAGDSVPRGTTITLYVV